MSDNPWHGVIAAERLRLFWKAEEERRAQEWAVQQARRKIATDFLQSAALDTVREWAGARDLDAAGYLAAMARHTLDRWPMLKGVPDRNLATLSRTEAKLTLKQLGYLIGVTPERCRQIALKTERLRAKRQALWEWRQPPLPDRTVGHPDFAVQVWTPEAQFAEIMGA